MGSNEPTNVKERICDEAFDLIERRCAEEGLAFDRAFLTYTLMESDETGENASTGFRTRDDGPFDGRDVFFFLLSATHGLGKAVGITVMIAPLGKG